MIKICAKELFAVEVNKIVLDKINPAIDKFINHPYKNGALKYDIQNKLGKAIYNELEGITEFRNRLIEECREEKNINSAGVNKKLIDLFNSEISVEAAPVSLSLLLNEDCSGFNFGALDKFIIDDRM